MPAKKTKKKAVIKKKTVKKAVNKKTSKKPAKAKSKAVKKKVAKKAPAKKKKIAAKKKVVKKSSTAKPKAKKAKTTKKVTKPVKKAATPKKTSKIKVTKTKIATKIKAPKKTKEAPPPTIKEEVRVDTTMEEVEIAPYAINKNEDYMTEEQLEHFRKILLRWKQQLMQEVDSTVVHMQEDGLSFPDPIDRAAQEEGFNLELRTRDRERKLIKKIESALDSIETGDYGYCEDCGAEIGVRRLEARPTAEKCIDCKTYEEIREKQGSVR